MPGGKSRDRNTSRTESAVRVRPATTRIRATTRWRSRVHVHVYTRTMSRHVDNRNRKATRDKLWVHSRGARRRESNGLGWDFFAPDCRTFKYWLTDCCHDWQLIMRLLSSVHSYAVNISSLNIYAGPLILSESAKLTFNFRKIANDSEVQPAFLLSLLKFVS